MGFFSDLMGWMPGIGDAVDMIEGWIGIDDTSRTNRNNLEIAEKNVEMQRETNANNLQISREANSNQANIAKQFNANQVQLQNDMNVFNKQMWDLNNEYNSPSRQLERARAAGINPNIVFGQPVASSPVQQTSIPNQSMPSYNIPRLEAPRLNMRYEKSMRKLGDVFRGLAKIPLLKEEFEQAKAKTRQDNANAALLEEEAKKVKERRNAWENMSVIRSLDGRYAASPEEFDSMSDEDKKLFVKPYAYKDTRFSGRLINTLDNISDEQKKFYEPLYDFQKAKFEKLGLHSAEEYEDYKKRHSYGNTMLEIRADAARNKLQLAVDEGKVKDRGVVHSLIHMEEKRYEQLVEIYRRLKRENQWSEEDRPFELEMLGLNKKAIERQASHDFFTYIDKIGNDDMSAVDYIKMLLVGLHDILTGGASFAPYLFSKKK